MAGSSSVRNWWLFVWTLSWPQTYANPFHTYKRSYIIILCYASNNPITVPRPINGVQITIHGRIWITLQYCITFTTFFLRKLSVSPLTRNWSFQSRNFGAPRWSPTGRPFPRGASTRATTTSCRETRTRRRLRSRDEAKAKREATIRSRKWRYIRDRFGAEMEL